jgi:hypothetical protein
MRVQVYWNTHTRNFSVRDAHTGLVINHVDAITLQDAIFHVSEAGRQRVLRDGHKNVHAWVEGVQAPDIEPRGRKVSYNPRKAAYFFEIETGAPVERADIAILVGKQIWIS